MFMSHPQMASIVTKVILQASPPPKTQAVSAQTSLELLSSSSPSKSKSSKTTEKPSDQPAKDAENNESRDKEKCVRRPGE